jgi:hypothetical protein
MYTSRTATSEWGEPTRIFSDTLPVRAPELARTASGDLVLLFSERVGMKGPFRPIFASALSYLREGRACGPSR